MDLSPEVLGLAGAVCALAGFIGRLLQGRITELTNKLEQVEAENDELKKIVYRQEGRTRQAIKGESETEGREQ